MDLYAGAMLGAKGVPDGRMEKWVEGTLLRGPRWECPNGISDGQEERRNREGFLYSD